MSSSHFSTSFSAAAASGKDSGTNSHPPSSAGAGSGGVSGGGANSADWTRRANGSSSISTTRRPSLSTTLTHPINPLASTSSNVYHPPHHYNRQSAANNTTYGKEDLLSIFRNQDTSGTLSKNIPDLLEGDLNSAGSGGWGRSEEPASGVELCWEKEGGLKPIAFEDLTEEERELFSGSVNSPHKVLNNNTNNNQGTPNHHALNHTPPQNRNKVGGVGVGATPASRPGTGRRRETSDAATGGNPFSGTPTQLQRRRTDLRDNDDTGSPTSRTFFGRWGSSAAAGEDENKEKDDPSGTGGRNTGLFRRGSAAWGSSTNSGVNSSSALNSPMGTFGNNTFGGGGAMGGFTLQPSDKQKKGPSSVTRPGVENVDERGEEDDSQRTVLPGAVQELRQNDERERPTSSDTDPFAMGMDRVDQSHQEQRNQPLNAFEQQQRVKASSPFGGMTITTSNMSGRGNSVISTPTKARNDLGFTPFGGSRDTPNNALNMGMSGLQHQLQNLQFNNQGQVPLRRSREGSLGGALAGDNEPLSPAETNPFMSPPPEKADEHEMMNDMNEGGGLGSVIAGLRRGEPGGSAAIGSDRSGRSSAAGLGSVGGALGGGGFGGLGGAGLWSSAQMTPGGSSVTAGPNSFFGGTSLAELSSPGGQGSGSLLSGGLGGVGPLGGPAFGSASRASRLGQLFPENQHQEEQGFDSDSFGPDSRFNAFGSRRGLGGAIDSPMRERGDVADLFGFPSSRSFSNLAGAAGNQENTIYPRGSQDPLGLGPSHDTQHGSPLGQQNAQASAASGIRPPPGAIPPVMVMPDKINWVYRDPSGTIQGPFSGLEMHEWYRAGFFTQDLAVKRVEDTEFEQLGLLVRRIGNTREPFLVPLPGNSSAGMSTNAVSANWSETWLNEMQGAPQAQAQTPGSMQPPFAGSFPTFGTTLTAEQQNALERRKQEEQYLMAKQREFLLQQQMMAKQAAVAQQLHHQSSTQSLHSQPSFGSLHSPSGFPPSSAPTASIVGGQNAFEPGVLLRQAGAAAGGADPLNIGASNMQAQGGQFPPQSQQQDQVIQMQQQQRLAEQQRQQQLQRNYQTQQTQHVEKQLQDAQDQVAQQAQLQQIQQREEQKQVESEQKKQAAEKPQEAPQPVQEPTTPAVPTKPVEQPKVNVPKAPAAIKTSPPTKPADSAWGASPLVQPFPPPPSQESPTTAATASPVAAETPSASVAPWAKEAEQAVKTPSLKEIQELEAKQAAVREAAEAQARREMLAQQALQAPPPPAPGLPSTATWATSPSTTPASGGASAWNKPLAKANSTASSSRKTLSQIQKEEEVRKAKAAAANVASQAAVASAQPLSAAVGKRYADLASKAAGGVADKGAFSPGTSAWTTVGPGGKSRGAGGSPAPPTTPTAPSQTVKTMGSGVGLISTNAVPKKTTTPVPSIKPATTSAQDEFLKWCRGSMKGLNTGVTPEQVIDTVSTFPSDSEIIADTIYTVSSTMDGRRWAEEYIKRREAAGSGVVIESGTAAAGGAGGWNEVAKRPQAQQQPSNVPETNNAFRVVAGKKKGGRRA